jgi:hypothetical protein
VAIFGAIPFIGSNDVAHPISERRDRPHREVPERYPTPERTIDAACRLIDEGYDVYGVGNGPLTDAIDREQIAVIYAMWKREKFPRGISD